MTIRNNVTFGHPAEFVESRDFEGILSTDGVGWFVQLLGRIPRVVVDPDLCQEDWGVAIFLDRDGYSFWVGLSPWDEGTWLAHVHHAGLFQRFRRSGKEAYASVAYDLSVVLANTPDVEEPEWYYDADVGDADVGGASSPLAT